MTARMLQPSTGDTLTFQTRRPARFIALLRYYRALGYRLGY